MDNVLVLGNGMFVDVLYTYIQETLPCLEGESEQVLVGSHSGTHTIARCLRRGNPLPRGNPVPPVSYTHLTLPTNREV